MPRLFKTHLIRLIISILVLVFAILGIIWFAHQMRFRERQVVTTNARLVSYDRNKKIFAQETAALTAIEKRIVALEAYRVTPATTPELLSSIEARARVYDIDFTITTAQTPGAQNSKQKLLIDFSATGDMQMLQAFLADLMRQPYQIKFVKFALFADSDVVMGAVEQGNVLASIQVISF